MTPYYLINPEEKKVHKFNTLTEANEFTEKHEEPNKKHI